MGRPDDLGEERARSGTQAVERALAILDLFREGPAEQGISEIARRVDLRVPTAHRIVRALVARQYLEQDGRTERYRLGTTVAVLGQQALAARRLDLARPVLDRLAETSGESTALASRRSGTVLVVLKSASARPLRFDHPLGDPVPVHASAMAKALLAFSYASVAEAVEGLGRLDRLTDRTVTTHRALVAELEAVRERGWATNVEERYEGVHGVAAPVFAGGDATTGARAWAAVGVHGPSTRLTPDRFAATAALAKDAAAEIGRVLVDHHSAAREA
jgi:IclR family transcriptional regulator, acetate operon repressor